MTADRFNKIRQIAADNIAKLRVSEARFLELAKADPLNAEAVRRAHEALYVRAGYERAIEDIVDGMIAAAVTS